MIADGLLFIAGSLLSIPLLLFKSFGATFFSQSIVNNFSSAVHLIIAPISYIQTWFPVDTLFQDFVYYLGVWALMLFVKVVLLGYSAIPFIGKKVSLPKHKLYQ